jgi:predicted methyltransferase MtxX (methanogen marker protein 4)
MYKEASRLLSEQLRITNAVKQGGVITPVILDEYRTLDEKVKGLLSTATFLESKRLGLEARLNAVWEGLKGQMRVLH